MLVINADDAEYFGGVMTQAVKLGLINQFLKQLQWLSEYANRPGCMYDCEDGKNTRCKLFKDFAPLSFTFSIEKTTDNVNWEHWFNGGLIYQGPSCPADGSFPSLTVSLNSTKHGWFAHT